MGNHSDPVAHGDARVATGSNIPIGVEESRAQRLQRQQARFRDRGGIFIPSTRNTLGDILCGRSTLPSPRKPRKPRSESIFPRRGQETLFPEVQVSDASAVATQVVSRRTSPRKPLKKPVYDELEARLEPIAGPSRLYKDGKPVSRTPTSRKSKTKADDALRKPAPKRRGRPPKAKVHPEVNEERENTSTKEHANPKSKSEAKSKPMKAAVTRSTAKVTDGPDRKRSTKPTADKAGGNIVKTANGDIAPDQGRDPNRKGKSKGRGKAKAPSAVETGVSSMQWNKNEDGHDTNSSALEPNNGEGFPIPFAEDLPQRLGKGRKRAIIKTVPVEDIDTDLARETEELERAKPTSKKRASPPEAHDKDAGDDAHHPTSRKRLKAARRNDSVPEGKTTAVKINASGQASEKLVENSDQVTSLTDKPTSKKRSREPGHVDSLEYPIIAKPRKRMKTSPARDKPMAAIDVEKDTDVSRRIVDQGGGNPRKTLKLASRKYKENTPTAKETAELINVSKSSKSTSKLKGPPASVLKRVKQPLPIIEDDDPDPINFLL